MASYPAKIQIDEEHSRGICAEIGDRLRIALGDPLPIPPDLARLIARLGDLDEHDSPSIVPSIEGVSPRFGIASHIERSSFARSTTCRPHENERHLGLYVPPSLLVAARGEIRG